MAKKFFSENDVLSLTECYSIAKESKIKDKLLFEITQANNSTRQYIEKGNPFYAEQRKFKAANRELRNRITSIAAIVDDFENFRSLATRSNAPIQEGFWLSKMEELKEEQHKLLEKTAEEKKTEKKKNKEKEKSHIENQLTTRHLIQKHWKKLLDQKYSEWEIKTINTHRKNLLKKLREWLDLLQQLDSTLSDLSLDAGLLFDLSKGNISLSDIEDLKNWADYISKDEGVRTLCDIMGRLRRAERTKRQEMVERIKTIDSFIPDISSKEEITGIHLSRDIEHALPHEIALLSDDDMSVLFDLKLVEGRLSSFLMESFQAETILVEEEISVEEEEKLGPMIICVDTSGSMQGAPETVAKAVTLFMATRAMQQSRNCFLINFSTEIETLDLSQSLGFAEVIKFLQRSFHGGTDASPALEYAIKLMRTKEYEKSDLLIISDFIMAALPESLRERVGQAKKKKNKFYSLAIGSLFLEERLKSIFDNEWIYNPSSFSIQSLQGMVDAI